jgi:hypothetical protein
MRTTGMVKLSRIRWMPILYGKSQKADTVIPLAPVSEQTSDTILPQESKTGRQRIRGKSPRKLFAERWNTGKTKAKNTTSKAANLNRTCFDR